MTTEQVRKAKKTTIAIGWLKTAIRAATNEKDIERLEAWLARERAELERLAAEVEASDAD